VHRLPSLAQVEVATKGPRLPGLANGIGSSRRCLRKYPHGGPIRRQAIFGVYRVRQSPTLEAQWAQEDAKEPQTINIEQLAAESGETKKFTRVPSLYERLEKTKKSKFIF